MKNRFFSLALGSVLAILPTLALAQTSPLVTRSQDALLQVVQSNTTRKEKADACRELAVIGDRKAVPVLVPLLADAELSHNARHALETMRGGEVDQALRNELPKLQGRLLVGVIASLGVRQDAKAVKPLAELLASPDESVAQAAARALGSIGDPAGVRAIESALPQTSPANRLAFYEGLFRSAEQLAARRKSKEAVALYDELRKATDAPHQVRAGALRGAIVTRGSADLALFKESLASSDRVLFHAAIRAGLELGGSGIVRALIGSLPQLVPDNQIVVLQALGQLGDSLAVPAVHALTKSSAASVRVEAVGALASIGHALVVPVLTGLLTDADRDVAQAALEGLAGIPGGDADAAVLKLIKSPKPEQRLIGINLAGRRRLTSAAPALSAAAADSDARVRTAALQRLERLGTTAELQALLKLVLNTTAPEDLGNQAEAIGSICARSESPAASIQSALTTYDKAQPSQKAALLSVMSTVGGDKALAAVRGALAQANPQVRAAALKALANWPDAAAQPDLLRLVQAGGDATDRAAAFRGYVRLIRESTASADEKLKQLTQAASLSANSQEKMLVLAALGDVVSVDALKLAASHLGEPAVADEAGAVTVKIAEKLDPKFSAEIGPALGQVLKSTKTQGVLNAARKRLTQLNLPAE